MLPDTPKCRCGGITEIFQGERFWMCRCKSCLSFAEGPTDTFAAEGFIRNYGQKSEAVGEAFESGDVVKLNSGGPNMTVVGARGVSWVECGWFDDGKKFQHVHFDRKMLKLVEKRPVTS